MEQPLFTIITVTYNSSKWVGQAIESVLASSYTDFEYIIADDCSSDETWSIIQEYNDPRIRAWRNNSNMGEYPNRNAALREAKGRYIYFIDGDDVINKHALRNLREYIYFFPDAIMIWGVPPAAIDFAVLPYQFEPPTTMRLIYESSAPMAMIGFTETVFRRDALKRVGFLSEEYAIGDTYIKKRLALEGPVLLVAMGFAFWRRSDTQASRKASLNYSVFLEAHNIDLKVVSMSGLLNKEKLICRIKGSFIRRLFRHTLLKGRILLFFQLYRKSGLSLADFRNIFERFGPAYSPAPGLSHPLINRFHFTK
ncbi:MAG TPA: glycosyltransferase family 2 protein [Lacibacter sp.]|nr:glycosyltransferase family 2 protein [Lacibacter sp.]HMP85646.1 glycosyltransferase family 2 protein [Lacibacter sp.]